VRVEVGPCLAFRVWGLGLWFMGFGCMAWRFMGWGVGGWGLEFRAWGLDLCPSPSPAAAHRTPASAFRPGVGR